MGWGWGLHARVRASVQMETARAARRKFCTATSQTTHVDMYVKHELDPGAWDTGKLRYRCFEQGAGGVRLE